MVTSNKIAGIVFDCEGVLFDTSALHRWMFQEARRLGMHSHFNLFYQLWRCEFYPSVCSGEVDYWETLERFLRQIGFGQGQVDEICLCARSRFDQGEILQPLAGVARVLRQLQALRIPIGFLARTRLSRDELQQQIQRMNVRCDVESIATTADVRCLRFETNDFHRHCARFRLDPSQVAFVCGDFDHLSAARQADLIPLRIDSQWDEFSAIDRLEDLIELCCRNDYLRHAG